MSDPEKSSQKSKPIKPDSESFSEQERTAMKERAAEVKAFGRDGRGATRAACGRRPTP